MTKTTKIYPRRFAYHAYDFTKKEHIVKVWQFVYGEQERHGNLEKWFWVVELESDSVPITPALWRGVWIDKTPDPIPADKMELYRLATHGVGMIEYPQDADW